eukprot:g10596.t1
MFTKKQRWRRVRVLRSNSAGSFSSTDSGSSDSSSGSMSSSISGGGSSRSSSSRSSNNSGGGGEGDTREGFFPAIADRSRMADTAAAEAAAAAIATATTSSTAVPEDTNDSMPQPPSPPPRPPPRQRAPPAPPHGRDPGGLDPQDVKNDEDAKTGAGPTSTPRSPADQQPHQLEQQQQYQQHPQQHPNNLCGGGGGGGGGGGNAILPNHNRHPLDVWRISVLNALKFLFFFEAGGGNDDGRMHAHRHHGRGFGGEVGGNRERAATEGCHPLAAVSAARPRRPSEPASLSAARGRVRFSHQVRVILVASRMEMSSVKADVWWGDKDYCDFRRAYLSAAREKKTVDRSAEFQRRPVGDVRTPPGHGGSSGDEELPPHKDPPATPPPATASSTASCDVESDDGDSRARKPPPGLPRPLPPAGATYPSRACGGGAGGRRGDNNGGEAEGVDADRRAALDLDKLGAKAGAPTVRPVPPTPPPAAGATAGVAAEAEPAPVSDGGAAPTPAVFEGDNNSKSKQAVAATAEAAAAVVLTVPVPTAPCATSASALGREGGFEPARNQDPSTDVAVVARGFPWRAAGTGSRAEAVALAAAEAAARRSPGSSMVGAARASSRAFGGGVRWKRPSGEPKVVLEMGRDLRVDPRTGGRVPLTFLGERPIRRVASV